MAYSTETLVFVFRTVKNWLAFANLLCGCALFGMCLTLFTQARAEQPIPIHRVSNGAILIGVDRAPHQIAIYLSSTSPHSGEFLDQRLSRLISGPVKSGEYNLSIRPYARNAFDLAQFTIAGCVPESHYLPYLRNRFANLSGLIGSKNAADRLNLAVKGAKEPVLTAAELSGAITSAPDFGLSEQAARECVRSEARQGQIVEMMQQADVCGLPEFFLDGTKIGEGTLLARLKMPVPPGISMNPAECKRPNPMARITRAYKECTSNILSRNSYPDTTELQMGKIIDDCVAAHGVSESLRTKWITSPEGSAAISEFRSRTGWGSLR